MEAELRWVAVVRVSCLSALALGAGGRLVVAAETAPRPNILVIMSDEHNAGVLGAYGNRIVRTPNLDRLAQRGVTFDAAYTNSPLCVPCRLSFTAGKYASRVGAWSNDCWLPSDDYPSIARVMTAAGYEALLCGKMHFDRTRRYGFKELVPLYTNGLTKTGLGDRRPVDALTARRPDGGERFSEIGPGDDSSVLKHDQKVTQTAVEFFKKRRTGDKPFFLILGYVAPHFPLIVPQQYYSAYKGKVPMPDIPSGHLESLPLNYKLVRAGFNITDVDPQKVREARELYYGLTQWVDERIGEVLAALDQNGLAERTVVIYTTDHGESMGEHGLWWKNCMFDHAARVPLIISWPARWPGGQRRAAACSLVDVVQTIADLGGGSTPDDWDGDSLVGWMDDARTPWKNLAVSEYYAHNIASGFVMLRSGKYKYVYHTPPDAQHGAERELYDLAADPGEFHNLAKDPSQRERIEAMHAALVKELGENPDVTEQRARVDLAKGYGRERPQRPNRPAAANRPRAANRPATRARP